MAVAEIAPEIGWAAQTGWPLSKSKRSSVVLLPLPSPIGWERAGPSPRRSGFGHAGRVRVRFMGRVDLQKMDVS